MRPVGCLECRMTGYYGRIGIYEVMLVTPTLRRLVTRESDDRAIREQAFKDGMKPLRVSGAMKIASLPLHEANERCYLPGRHRN